MLKKVVGKSFLGFRLMKFADCAKRNVVGEKLVATQSQNFVVVVVAYFVVVV